MLATFVISFREFLEAFLIIGVFFGLSKKLHLAREKEISTAALLGIAISLALPAIVFFVGDGARHVMTERNADLLEGYLMTFSGFFLAYVIFSLHKFFTLRRSGALIRAHQKMEQNIFDLSLFLTIVFFVIREGFEIALFSAATSLFSRFAQNIVGLMIGFAASAAVGLLTYKAYLKFPIGKIYRFTEYLIVLLGAAFVSNGIGELTTHYLKISVSNILPIKLSFLPTTSTILGHVLKNIIGIEQDFSLGKLAIMTAYIAFVYVILIRKPPAKA